jgi:hypothetical protein
VYAAPQFAASHPRDEDKAAAFFVENLGLDRVDAAPPGAGALDAVDPFSEWFALELPEAPANAAPLALLQERPGPAPGLPEPAARLLADAAAAQNARDFGTALALLEEADALAEAVAEAVGAEGAALAELRMCAALPPFFLLCRPPSSPRRRYVCSAAGEGCSPAPTAYRLSRTRAREARSPRLLSAQAPPNAQTPAAAPTAVPLPDRPAGAWA